MNRAAHEIPAGQAQGAAAGLDNLPELLNPPQLEAVYYGEGPLLVLAGAGSGKTRVITYRIARLVASGVNPKSIIALTFTNKAAGEMKERVRSLLGQTGTDIWISTFHSACLRVLRRDADRLGYGKDFVIYDSQDQERLIKLCMAQLGVDEKANPARQAGAMISSFKNKLKGADEAEKELNPRRFEDFLRVFHQYERKLMESRCMDFDDLLGKSVELLRKNEDIRERYQRRFSHVLVDEFQDTNAAQYEFVRLMTGGGGSICVVGDDDQSIYQWRGANIGNILNFEKDYPGAKVIKLEQNYRSTRNILEGAHGVVSQNAGRKEKRLWTQNAAGEKIKLYFAQDEMDEGRRVATGIKRIEREKGRVHNDFAVFYRTNSQSRAIEDALRREGISYQVFGGLKFYERREIKDMLAYFRVALNPHDTVSLRRIINVPPRGIGATTVEKLAALAEVEGKSMAAALDEAEASAGFNSGTKGKLEAFREIMSKVRILATSKNAADAISDALTATGYMEWLAKEDDSEAANRMENLNELVNAAEDFIERTGENSIQTFLDQAALTADADDMKDGGAVKLMTVHVSKGLEFPVVFVTGLEEGIFPHARSKDNPSQMEEERRLMYVAMTRAMEALHITHARERRIFGVPQANRPSRFLRDIPAECVEMEAAQELSLFTPRAEDRDKWPKAPVKITRPTPAPVFSAEKERGIPPAARPASSPKTEGVFAAGDKVRHPMFQVGVIRSVEGRGENGKVTVYFPRFGEKKLILKHARLSHA
ncbi:MAG: UvrD-helicase domain-containing protein [Nitrospinae bacterium]|nr:UvrD-helicase domain-containing protein [Nitrospinota bacterium]